MRFGEDCLHIDFHSAIRVKLQRSFCFVVVVWHLLAYLETQNPLYIPPTELTVFDMAERPLRWALSKELRQYQAKTSSMFHYAYPRYYIADVNNKCTVYRESRGYHGFSL